MPGLVTALTDGCGSGQRTGGPTGGVTLDGGVVDITKSSLRTGPTKPEGQGRGRGQIILQRSGLCREAPGPRVCSDVLPYFKGIH